MSLTSGPKKDRTCQSKASWLCSRPKTASQAYSSNLEQNMRKEKCILFQGVLCSFWLSLMWPLFFFQNSEVCTCFESDSKIQISTQTSHIRKAMCPQIYSSLHLQNCHCSKIVKLSTCEIEIVTSILVDFLVWLQDNTAFYHKNLVRLRTVANGENQCSERTNEPSSQWKLVMFFPVCSKWL